MRVGHAVRAGAYEETRAAALDALDAHAVPIERSVSLGAAPSSRVRASRTHDGVSALRHLSHKLTQRFAALHICFFI